MGFEFMNFSPLPGRHLYCGFPMGHVSPLRLGFNLKQVLISFKLPTLVYLVNQLNLN